MKKILKVAAMCGVLLASLATNFVHATSTTLGDNQYSPN